MISAANAAKDPKKPLPLHLNGAHDVDQSWIAAYETDCCSEKTACGPLNRHYSSDKSGNSHHRVRLSATPSPKIVPRFLINNFSQAEYERLIRGVKSRQRFATLLADECAYAYALCCSDG